MTKQTATAPQKSPTAPGQSARPVIFIECTHTYSSASNNGIQRVVRNIVRHGATVGARHGYDVVPVVFRRGNFVRVDSQDVLADKTGDAPPIEATAEELETNVRPSRLTATQKVFREVRRMADQARRLAMRGWPASNRLVPAAGSILLLLDSSWGLRLWPAVRGFKRQGGHAIAVVYDLIPVSHPQTVPLRHTYKFREWLGNVMEHADALLGISKTVAHDLEDYLLVETQCRSGVSPIPTGHFHLGSELDLVDPGKAVAETIVRIFARNEHIFLMVGSIEPRKNHSFVLDVFDAFWDRGGSGTLVIVGRQSWMMGDFLRRIAAHPQYGKRLFLVRDASDADLAYCYSNASALIFASQVEGFGLPIVEAFQHGLRVFCSDIPVFREIAESKATFFALNDRDDLGRRIADFCAAVDPRDRAQRHPQPWIDWEQSTEQLFAAAWECVRQAKALAEINGGERKSMRAAPWIKQTSTAAALYIPSDVFAGTGQGDYMASANCIAADFYHPQFKAFCDLFKHRVQLQRKLWEWAFIHHHLQGAGVMVPGTRGIGFGVGHERLPALFAAHGSRILATDAPSGVAEGDGWRETGQHAHALDDLFDPDLIDAEAFKERVSFAPCDMNAIGERFTGFDFCWSACCFEHLGSIEQGLDFVVNSVEKTLKPGGVAVHTTELNLSSNTYTIASGPTVLFRRQDLEQLERRLTAMGHWVKPLRFDRGGSYLDACVDAPPYKADPHLKVQLGKFVTTSVGIVVKRGPL
jgi:glycosyltransferase involved in cell wall biosynthesis